LAVEPSRGFWRGLASCGKTRFGEGYRLHRLRKKLRVLKEHGFRAFLLLPKTSVPHPFRRFSKKKCEEKMRKGWDANEIQVYTISENASAVL
jgi:hypothetical protein